MSNSSKADLPIMTEIEILYLAGALMEYFMSKLRYDIKEVNT